MKIRIFLATFLFVLLSCAANKPKIDERTIGIWQASPMMAAGWAESYSFFPTGKFIYRINQSLCDERDKGFEGEFSIDGDTLFLNLEKEIVLVGGELVDARGSCFGDKEIINGELVTRKLKFPRIKKLFVSEIVSDENFGKLKLKIEGKDFWKHRDDPKQY